MEASGLTDSQVLEWDQSLSPFLCKDVVEALSYFLCSNEEVKSKVTTLAHRLVATMSETLSSFVAAFLHDCLVQVAEIYSISSPDPFADSVRVAFS